MGAERYGLPYMGSKNSIAEWVVTKFPRRENFYDLFCGGCAITHASLVTNKFHNFFANDLNPMSSLFIEAVNGKYHDEKRWISREEFEANKKTDSYIAFVWSFGNNGDGYMYSTETEKIKKALWYAVVYNDYSLADKLKIPFKRSKYENIKQRRLDVMRDWKKYGNKKIDKRMELQSLESLERLQSLERLERLQSLERLEFTCKSYNEVDILPNSLVYCDIPYKGTAEYVTGGFDHKKFYDWCHKQKELVIVSEYSMPSDFVCIATRAKRNILSTNKAGLEKLFVPAEQLDRYNELIVKRQYTD